MKIVTVLGARPQFIKASIVSKLIKKTNGLEEVIVHTGQHFDNNMSKIFFDELKIPKPNYFLNINQLKHGEMTGQMLAEIEKILIKESPDGILVYGDTNTTLAGSLAASKLYIPVFHIEAGLRSYNRSMPEEINRVLTDHVSSLLFCPTYNAVNNLAKEGINNGVVHSGDVMFDLFISSINNVKKIKDTFVLASIHRPTNTDNADNLNSIIKGLEKINVETKVIMPMHPRTKKNLENFRIKPNFKMIPPLSYIDMLKFLSNSKLIITDSGGVQKEAFFSKKKCITLRAETEWTELIEAGVNILCGIKDDEILTAYNKMCLKTCDFSQNLYGDGRAADKIIQTMVKFII